MLSTSKLFRNPSAGGATDPFFPYVPLLLETTTTNGQQNNTFLDSSTNNFTITRNGTPTQGSVTPYWPDGYWSNYFNGSTDYLNNAAATGINVGSSDFTVEAWVYLNSNSNYAGIFSSYGTASGNFGISLALQNTGVLYGAVGNASGSPLPVEVSSSGAVSTNAWNHVAFVRNGTSHKLYLNGVNVGTTTTSSASVNSTTFVIGRYYYNVSNYYLNGYISNLRLVNSAVYTANFTPPIAPLTAITGTQLLTCQSNRFKDNSTNNFTITPNGAPRAQAFQPFSPSASYTAAAYGGSLYNGTKTNFLSIPNSSAVTTYTGDFTLECWVNPTDTSLTSGWGILDTRTTGGTATSWVWSLTSYTSAGWIVQMYAGAAFNFTLRVLPYVWSHVVLQRNGSTLRCFVNGVVDGTALSFAGTLTGGAGVIAIGNTKDSASAGFGNVGYISNLRVVNGTAVYSTSGFTPPTAPVTAITNTSLLTNFANAGIYDAAVQNNQVTVGDAQASTTQSKWSPTSMKFDGTGDWLTMPGANIPALSGQFTIEFWVYFSSISATVQTICGKWNTSLFGWLVQVNNTSVQFSYGNGVTFTATLSYATTITTGTWYYIAITRNSSNAIQAYLNGSAIGSPTTVATSINSTSAFSIGVNLDGSQQPLNGYLQDFRLTNGVARTITTPTAAFPTR